MCEPVSASRALAEGGVTHSARSKKFGGLAQPLCFLGRAQAARCLLPSHDVGGPEGRELFLKIPILRVGVTFVQEEQWS
jgi:hypothetical protein